MKKNILAISLVAVAAGLSACQPINEGIETSRPIAELRDVKISGQVAYRERIALQPGSTLTVKLLDISRMGAPSVALAEQTRVLNNEQVPLDFDLSVKEHKLKTNMRYAVRATITDPFGRLAWTTDTVYPVEANVFEQNLGTLKLVRVEQSDTPIMALIGKTWGIENIAGAGIIDNSNVTVSSASDGTVSGSNGCNNFTGKYEVNGDKLEIGTLAVTRRACNTALADQETRFMGVIGKVTGWSQDRWQRMVLTTDDGQILVGTERN